MMQTRLCSFFTGETSIMQKSQLTLRAKRPVINYGGGGGSLQNGRKGRGTLRFSPTKRGWARKMF